MTFLDKLNFTLISYYEQFFVDNAHFFKINQRLNYILYYTAFLGTTKTVYLKAFLYLLPHN